ncbi:hypothetical protein N0V93_001939 [Gnomoniopsis smithogilvyi]|uniref:Nitroreductase domain-containing protein n=1 Tax=Gnomoniopsis smithogilvyi TaxID=1191159 RepID=A0A9W8Z2Z0_9PEZI|nr:hypothetical protein N0V93_001939 [Gnomoniopsis smithogilvyi]
MSGSPDIAALLQARYGSPPAWPISSTIHPTPALETLLAHHSVRAFLSDKPLPDGTLELLVAAGQSAATSSNLQTWSVVSLSDPEMKRRAAVLSADQAFIHEAPLFLIFCADLQRLTAVSELRGTGGQALEYTEMFLMASIDAALASQNVAVAAEALGLGACYVGAVRNRPREMADLLALPERVIALFGLAVGFPDPQRPASVKPRLGIDEVLHKEGWGGGHDGETQVDKFSKYDDALASFNAGQKREGVPAWTERSAKRVEGVSNLSGRHIWGDVLKERGFDMK